ncbi:MAG: acyl-CoA thioesterase, partial [Anaerolineae bacterium]
QIVLDSPLPLQPLMEEHNAAPIVLETRITYHKALRLFDQDVRAVMWVHAMDGVFFTTHSHILRGEELIAEAVQRNAIVRMGRSLTPMRLPRSFRDAFKAYDYDPALTVSQSHF